MVDCCVKMLKLVLVVLCLWSVSAQAVEIRSDAVWWQYEEITKQHVKNYATTPLKSKASTITLAITTDQITDINSEWQWKYEFSSIIPTIQASEHWSLGNGLQTNDLRIGQLDGKLELIRKLNGVNIGLWGALRWQQQARQHFKQNGVSLPDPLVTETIRTAWLGGAISGEWWRVEGGVPLWVRTTNSSINNVFSKRGGYRVGGELHGSLIKWLAADIAWHGGYHYQQLDGEIQASALWPKNRFQTVSLGASAEW